MTVTLKFWRELDPAWYFSPLERYAVGLTGDYLIGAYFGGGMMETLTPEKQIVLIRLLSVFVPLTLAYVLMCMQKITYRQLTGIYLATLWCFLVLLFLNPLIIHFGGWTYNVHPYTYHQTPVDLVIGWAIFWGAIPHLSRTSLPVWVWVLLLFGLDVALMPQLGSIVTLHRGWMIWELVCLALAFVPSWYLARWTKDRKFLYLRSFHADDSVYSYF